MKLATIALVASFGLVGCASDNEGSGGAYLEGLRPAKPSIDDQKSPVIELNPAISHVLQGGLAMGINNSDLALSQMENVVAETINVPFPINGLCDVCEVVTIRSPRNPAEINVLDDFGNFFCRIWIDDRGFIESTDCR